MPIYKTNKKRDGLFLYTVRVNYTDKNGKAHGLTRTAVGAEAAKLLESQLTAEYKTGQITPAERMTVGELAAKYLAAKRTEVRRSTAEKTERILNRYVLPTMQKERLDRLNAQKLQDWKQSITALSLAPKTQKNIYGEFRTMLNFAVKMEHLPRNPLLTVGNFKDTDFTPPTDKLQYYTADEFLRYKAAALADAETRGTLSEYAYYVFFCIAYYMGMRKGEINALRWSDINGGLLTVRRSVTQKVKGESAVETLPKNKTSYRTIEIPAPLMEILAEYKKRLESRDAYQDNYRVCGGGESGVLTDSNVDRHNRRYADMAGLKHIRVHDFRHPYVKHTTKIFSLRLMDFQAQAYPDARRKTRGACQLLRVGQSRSPVRPLCNRKRFSCLPPQSKMSWILYAISMRLSGYTSTRSISSSASSVVSVSASKIALDASFRLSCRACSSCFCFACANTAA